MQLYHFEEQLKRMREQGADDYTEILIEPDNRASRFVKKLELYMPPSNHAKRIINIRN